MKLKKKIALGADHAGFEFKSKIKTLLPDINWLDLGPSNDSRVDYPDFAEKVCRAVVAGKADYGVLICGSGIGMSIAANKINGIRAVVVESEFAARLSRQHNDANVLCLGARVLAPEYAKEIVSCWLQTQFEGGRHSNRVKKIADLEKAEKAHERNKAKSLKSS